MGEKILSGNFSNIKFEEGRNEERERERERKKKRRKYSPLKSLDVWMCFLSNGVNKNGRMRHESNRKVISWRGMVMMTISVLYSYL